MKWGWLDFLVFLVSATLVVAFFLIVFGGSGAVDVSIGSGGASVTSRMAEIVTVKEQNRTERTRIEQREQTERWLATTKFLRWFAVAAAVTLIAYAVAAVAMKRAQQPAALPPAELMLWMQMQQLPGARVDVVDGEWAVVDDAKMEIVPWSTIKREAGY